MIENDQKKLNNLIMLISEIADIKDFDVIMDKILKSAREFVNCDAGSIFIKKENTLLFSYSQNDTLSKRLKLGQKLLYTTFSLPINERSIAGHVAFTGEALNIEDAYSLPKSLSYPFNKQYDERAHYKTRSILTIPMKTSSGKIIGVLQLINKTNEKAEVIPFNPDEIPYINSFANITAGALERAQLMRMVILRMIRMAELRDPKETGNHVNRVAGYSIEIYETWAKKMGVSQDEISKSVDVLRMAAMLHDVGKVAISDTILKKPARLNDEEYEIMKQHTVLGAKLFDDTLSDFGETARLVALNHHERYDGMGYPGHIDSITGNPLPDHLGDNGKPIPKKGKEIPLYGRIVALADVYDALSSKRVYKEAWDEDKILSVIHKEKGKHFDPEIVDAFFSCIDTIRSIAERYDDQIP